MNTPRAMLFATTLMIGAACALTPQGRALVHPELQKATPKPITPREKYLTDFRREFWRQFNQLIAPEAERLQREAFLGGMGQKPSDIYITIPAMRSPTRAKFVIGRNGRVESLSIDSTLLSSDPLLDHFREAFRRTSVPLPPELAAETELRLEDEWMIGG